MKNLFVLLFFGIFLFLNLSAQSWDNASVINDRLGRGMNMGNTFEAPSEEAWSNPWKSEYFDLMADMGFKHVRIPIRWEPSDRSMANHPYTISPTFFARIKEVVDKALEKDMMAIINMHHHDEMLANPVTQKQRFLAQWQQIADYFKDYPQELLFEVFNEPNGAITPALWNALFAEALDVIRATNPHRVVLMGTADYGGLSGVPFIELPDDDRIILSVHYYNPFEFTHQGASWVENSNEWLGTEWLDTEADRMTVVSEFAATIAFSQQNNIPIHVGEFGAFSTAEIESRARWTTFMARWFEEKGFSWAYWEFSSSFGIYNPITKVFNSKLVDALLHNAMPEPKKIQYSAVYLSDFSQSSDGWQLAINSPAVGALNRANSELTVNISNAGTEGWHAQLNKTDITLEQGKEYRIFLRAKSSNYRNVRLYLGKDYSDYSAYSNYYDISLSNNFTEFGYTFTMLGATDNSVRISFDMGTEAGDMIISEIRLEKVEPGTLVGLHQKEITKVFPNPFLDVIYFDEVNINDTVLVYDLSGALVHKQSNAMGGVNLSHLTKGVYMAKLVRNSYSNMFKIIKE